VIREAPRKRRLRGVRLMKWECFKTSMKLKRRKSKARMVRKDVRVSLV
jgi:hypothetical protein